MTDITGTGIPAEEPDDTDVLEEQMPESGQESPIDLAGLSGEELLLVVDEALDQLSFEELTEVIRLAEERRREKQEDARRLLMEEFRERAAQLGFPFESLFPSAGRRRRSDAGQSLPVMYRGPNNETWSGRGRKPAWLSALEAIGHDKEEYKVEES